MTSNFHQQILCVKLIHRTERWPGRLFDSCFARTPIQTQEERRWINKGLFLLPPGQLKTKAPVFPAASILDQILFFISVYSLTLYKRKLISKCKCSYKNSQHLFKFRNLFCLIHKLYIALVKKTKTKNSENMTISKVQVPQTFKDHISESCLYHSEEP